MKRIVFPLLFPILLGAEITTTSISSERASYDGNALILKGAVQLEHSIGKIESGGARLIRDKKEGPFSEINLTDGVTITLKNDGKIDCAKANFDFVSMTGKFLPKPGELIHFTNLDDGELSLSSKKAEVEFKKQSETLKLSKIVATEMVQMDYGDDFTLRADGATYTEGEIPYLVAMPNCILTHFNDRIVAEKIELLPQAGKVILSSPKGHLHPTAFSHEQEVEFSCNRLIWEKAPHLLTLRGDVLVKDSGIGDLRCDDEVELRQREQDGKWIVSSITANGKTQLTYEMDADFKHLLICYGQMQLDQDRLVLTLESPHQQPLEYYHDKMKLCADRAQLDYVQLKKTIRPQRLLLSGNVLLSEEENQTRCGLADQFLFFPDEQKIILTAKSGENVLFWDEEKELSISAREVHIFRNEKGENVKGVGNVRFAFSSVENELLKKIFPFYKTEGASHE